jgi:hypothetical protein
MSTSNTPFHSAPPNTRRQPMTPEQLDALRPKPAVATPFSAAAEAKRIAYQAGVSQLEGIILRLQALEREIADLKSKQSFPSR